MGYIAYNIIIKHERRVILEFQKVSLERWILDSNMVLGQNPLVKNISYDNIKIPCRATKKSAGYDFYTPCDVTIGPDCKCMIPTGIRCVNMPKNSALLVVVRSSIGIKKGCSLSNQVAVIDADYAEADNEGHIFISLKNTTNGFVTFEAGERIAQGIIVNYLTVDNEELPAKDRTGGLGSTN